MTFARLCAHYVAHAAWLEDGELLRGVPRLAGIRCVPIHGRSDIGRGGTEMTEQMMTALNRFARTQVARWTAWDKEVRAVMT